MALFGEWLVKRAGNTDVERKHLNKILQEISTATSSEAIQDIVAAFLVAGTNISLTYNDPANTLTVAASGGGGGGNSVTVACDFGEVFTDKAQTVVTGESWVTDDSEIVASLRTPTGVDPDEIRLLNIKPVISDLVAGIGFTLTAYSEPEAKGSYDFMCIGV